MSRAINKMSMPEGLFSTIMTSGNIRLQRLNTSRNKICMLFDVNELEQVEIDSLVVCDGRLKNIYREVLLDNDEKIVWIQEEHGRSIILKDCIVRGCTNESPWVFMDDTDEMNIMYVEEQRIIYDDGTYHQNPCRLAVTKTGKVVLEDYRRTGRKEFIKQVAEKELLGSNIEVDIENGIAKTDNLICRCKYMENKRYVRITTYAYKRASVRMEFNIIYDMKTQSVLNNTIYYNLEMLRGIDSALAGLCLAMKPDKYKTGEKKYDLIDTRALRKNDEEAEYKTIRESKYIEVLDGYYIGVSNADMHEVRNHRISPWRDRVDIVKFDIKRRKLVSVLKSSILEDSHNCRIRVRDNWLDLIKNEWGEHIVCSVKKKEPKKKLEQLILEGDEIVLHEDDSKDIYGQWCKNRKTSDKWEMQL